MPTVSIRMMQTPMPNVLLEIADQIGLSIVIPEEAETKTVTGEYSKVDAKTVLMEMARRMDLRVSYQGKVISFVSPDDEEKSFVVLRSGYIEPAQFQTLMKSQLGDKAQVERMDDRIIVTAPRDILSRAIEINEYAQTGADGWLLSIKVVTLTQSIKSELGLDWNINGTMTFSAVDLDSVLASNLIISAVANATETGVDAKLLDTAELYILEGTQSTLNRGQRIPVPKFTTTVEGATTVSGYDYLNTGFVLEVEAQRVPGGVRLHLQPTLSTVTGFVREAPITQESSITADVIVGDGDWIILSGLESIRDSNTQTSLPGLPAPIFGTDLSDQGSDTLYILVKATRVHASQK